MRDSRAEVQIGNPLQNDLDGSTVLMQGRDHGQILVVCYCSTGVRRGRPVSTATQLWCVLIAKHPVRTCCTSSV